MTIPRDVQLKIIQDVYKKWQEIYGDRDDAEAEAIIAAGASINLIERVYSLKEAADKLKNLLKAGDYLLLKASRGVSLEKIIPMLQA